MATVRVSRRKVVTPLDRLLISLSVVGLSVTKSYRSACVGDGRTNIRTSALLKVCVADVSDYVMSIDDTLQVPIRHNMRSKKQNKTNREISSILYRREVMTVTVEFFAGIFFSRPRPSAVVLYSM